jgi:hypothetical protein
MPRKPTRHKPSGLLKLVQQLTRAGTGQVYMAGTAGTDARKKVGRGVGGAERDRTAGLLVANEALSQLSYSPTGDFPILSAMRDSGEGMDCASLEEIHRLEPNCG